MRTRKGLFMKKRWNSEYKYYFLIALLGLVVIVSMISFTYAYSNDNKLVAEVSSLSEEEGQYVVDGIEDPYDLYSTFIDIIETATKTL